MGWVGRGGGLARCRSRCRLEVARWCPVGEASRLRRVSQSQHAHSTACPSGRPCRDGYWQGLPSRRDRPYRRGHGQPQRDPRVPGHPSRQDHPRAGRACPCYGGNRRVAGLRREEVALLAGISVEYYTRLERGNLGGVSDSVLDGARPRPAARRGRAGPPLRPGPRRRRPAEPRRRRRARASERVRPDDPAHPRRDDRRRRTCATAASTSSPPTDLGRALYAPLFDEPGRAAQQRPVRLPRPARAGLLRRLGHGRQRRRRVPARRGRPRPLRQGPVRPRRRALHPQRGVPHAGGPPTTCATTAPARKRLHHPLVGDLDLDYEALELPGDPGLRIIVYTAEPDSPIADALQPAGQLGGDTVEEERGRPQRAPDVSS